MLDTRRLLVLREVAAHGSVSGADAALGYTPDAVSQQLGALERETGRALVERHGRGIRLTDAAQALPPHAHDVLAALERANAALVSTATELTGTVRLASFPTATRALLPARLAALRARHPQLRVDLSELEPHESLPALALGRIDVAVAHEYDLVARDAARDLPRAAPSWSGSRSSSRGETSRGQAPSSWPISRSVTGSSLRPRPHAVNSCGA